MLCTKLLQLCDYVEHVMNDDLHGTNVVSKRGKNLHMMHTTQEKTSQIANTMQGNKQWEGKKNKDYL